MFFVTIAAVGLTVLSTASEAHEHAVVALNSENFEHATQAATGQTTGFWFVYFGKEDAAADQQMWRSFAEQQREDKPWLLHAFVDVDSNPSLAQRFGIKSEHGFIFFRNQKMYRFNADFVERIEPRLIEALTDFSANGWRAATAEKVPPDQHVTRGLSGWSLALVIAGAAVVAVAAALIGERVQAYYEKNTPVTANHAKGQ